MRTFSVASLPGGWYSVDTGYLPQKLGKTLLSKDSSESQLTEKQYLVIQNAHERQPFRSLKTNDNPVSLVQLLSFWLWQLERDFSACMFKLQPLYGTKFKTGTCCTEILRDIKGFFLFLYKNSLTSKKLEIHLRGNHSLPLCRDLFTILSL